LPVKIYTTGHDGSQALSRDFPFSQPFLRPTYGADRQSPGKTSASAKEEGPARGPRRRKEKIKSAGKQVIFPLTKKKTFVRFIEVLKKSIFLPSVNNSFGGGKVSYLCFY